MIARRQGLKPVALSLRINGYSIGDIERKLDIPRSTLSGWFKNIKLTKEQKSILFKKSLKSLANAREKAIKWHHLQKKNRLLNAENEALDVLLKANLHNKILLEIAFAMLYLGEGSKNNLTSLGNTNPLIVKFFIKSVKVLFGIDESQIRSEVHLRNDQDGNEMINYWSNQLEIPKTSFTAIKDKRPVKSKTYPNYKGVCVVRCGKIAIQRRVTYLGEEFCRKIIEMDD